MSLFVQDRIILDLCGGTGAWSRPYAEAGYDVRLITLPDQDVRLFKIPDERVWGILAAPPCDDFTLACTRYWKDKDADGRTQNSLSIVDACIRIVYACNPLMFWALENPAGRLFSWLGPYQHSFNPCDYGDPWTKRTMLWGRFFKPKPNPVEPVPSKDSWINKLGGHSEKTKTLRAITPPGFARAFFEANQ